MDNLTFMERIIWRVLVYSGIISIIFGTGIASWHNQSYLIGGLTVIVLGIALMATGYSIFQGKIKIQRGKETK
jgi:hypothetical protein